MRCDYMRVQFLLQIQVEKHPEASQRLNVEAAGHLAKLLSKYLLFVENINYLMRPLYI